MKNNQSPGFTLIELLVVIAIIGILSSVVLGALNTARDKGTDTAIKSNLNNARSQAELFYDNFFTYLNVCLSGSDNISSLVTAATNSGGVGTQCEDIALGWAANSQLKSTSASTSPPWYCVDYTGRSTTTEIDTITATDDISCN